ncbi:MAG: lipoyl(octanoyl) transferase LipB [Desulfobulbaceae bacterium]|uniref:Octanoyltransferase n=1 Tax=Candidatus Desulfobia pelagia TaxID=2841692 RepID=A0A8J6NEC5_9BACT|nr:lipoyl(octanoyl) transferase LipB [Candidatus Desulfobia pelagia]
MTRRNCSLYTPGCVEYTRALRIQHTLAELRGKGEIDDTLILLEHPPTYTLGKRSDMSHFRVPGEWVDTGRVAVHKVDRGGQITFHGPGQLVGYPVLRLDKGVREIVHYVRKLENVLVSTLSAFGVQSESRGNTVKNLPPTGVWVRGEKIGAIGIRIDSNRVTTHGFSLNISTDLDYFDAIIPCGITDRPVTSLERCLGTSIPMAQVIEKVMTAFAEVFRCECVEQTEKHAF